MVESEKLKVLKKFIYNSDVHKILSAINNGVMDYNILEIAGMGTQEIKHSNVLSWMFGDNEHNQGYKILLDFLLLVIEENDNSDLLKEIEILKEYIFLSTIMLPFFQTTKSNFLILPTYDTFCNSFSPLALKLLTA